jgi:hypothetical protein
MTLLFWAVMPCGLVGRYQRFGETHCPHGVTTQKNSVVNKHFVEINRTIHRYRPGIAQASSMEKRFRYVTRKGKHVALPCSGSDFMLPSNMSSGVHRTEPQLPSYGAV